jgi:hypothetical protein
MDRRQRIFRAAVLAVVTVSGLVFAQQPATPPAGQPPAGGQQPGGRQGAPPPPMSFFVTSVGKGDGANLGGLAGADAHCQALATAAGQGSRTWHAYLSANPSGQPAVNARDRIGNGPWFNGRSGTPIAKDVADLHGDTLDQARLGNNLSRTTVFSEKGEPINGAGQTPNEHDMLTGSQTDGRAYTDGQDHTCNSWTSNGTGRAQLGHFDRTGGGNTSWNSAHPSRGCSQPDLVATGGAGKFYCFAIN